MSEPSQAPVLVKPIPLLATYEGAPFGPIDLKKYIQTLDPSNGLTRFYGENAETAGPLPNGLICTQNGLLGGIPASGTAGTYTFNIIAENDADSLLVPVQLTINDKPSLDSPEYFVQFKAQVWEALGKDMPLPELVDAISRPITATEIYYLLQRFAVFTIWDVYNLEPAGEKKLLKLAGVSEHYNVYDRGSCIVGAPKDLFSYERTLADSLQTAKAMAREAYKRGWAIEFGGFNKMANAAWVELQVLASKHGKSLEVLHYTPPENIVELSIAQSRLKGPTI